MMSILWRKCGFWHLPHLRHKMLIIRVDGPYFLAKVKVGFGLVKVNTTQVPPAPFGPQNWRKRPNCAPPSPRRHAPKVCCTPVKKAVVFVLCWLCNSKMATAATNRIHATWDMGPNLGSSHPKDVHFVTQLSQMSKATVASQNAHLWGGWTIRFGQS